MPFWMSPTLMHGQFVYLVLFFKGKKKKKKHNVIITETCKKCKLQIEFELF